MEWDVLVPLKARERAKSRLRPVGEPARAALAAAMAHDVLAAALAAPGVARVWVVLDDDPGGALAALASALGARLLRDAPPGLDAALRAGEERVGGSPVAVAALCGDLACLRPEDLARALAAVPRTGRGLVADAAGTGTTLLAAAPGTALLPAYGRGSAARHRATGAVDLPAGPRLRLDVDTPEDLGAALALGAGPATVRAWASAGAVAARTA